MEALQSVPAFDHYIKRLVSKEIEEEKVHLKTKGNKRISTGKKKEKANKTASGKV